jgi:hypothetical protein
MTTAQSLLLPLLVSTQSSPLGQFLTLDFKSPYEHPRLGKFDSLLSQWYWQITGAQHDELRELCGEPLLDFVRSVRLVYTSRGKCEFSLLEGLVAKLKAQPAMRKAFLANQSRIIQDVTPTRLGKALFPHENLVEEEYHWINPYPLHQYVLSELRVNHYLLK